MDMHEDQPKPNGYHRQDDASSHNLSLSRAAILTGFEADPSESAAVDNAAALKDSPEAATQGEDPRENPTHRPQWAMPFNKLGLVLGVSSIGVLAVFFFASNLTKPLPRPAPKAELQTFPDPMVEGEARDQEKGRLKAEVALGDQTEAQRRLEEQNKQNPAQAGAKTTNSARPSGVSTSSATRPQRVMTPATPTRASYASYTPPRRSYRSSTYTPSPSTSSYRSSRSYAETSYSPSAGSDQPSTAVAPTAKTTVQADPFETWLVASQVGSYGQVSPDETGAETSNANSRTDNPDEFQPEATSQNSLRNKPSIATSSTATNATAGSAIAPAPTTPQNSTVQIASKASVAVVDPQEEAAILSEQPQKLLITGATVPGVLTTPLVWDEQGTPQKLVVLLSQPLRASDGQVALASGTQVLTEPLAISDKGIVRMRAIAAIVQQNGQQVEVPLPENALVVQGKKGGPLRAQNVDDKGPEIARMDVFSFALGAIAKASELFTRPTESVSIFNSAGGSVAQKNPQPNILAGVLEGGSETLLDQLEERNEKALDAIADRPNIPFLPAGTEVQIYVSQSTTLSSGFNQSPVLSQDKPNPSHINRP